MSEAPMLSLDDRMKRLDIMCDLMTIDLMKKEPIKKSAIRDFVIFTSMAVTQYLEKYDADNAD